MAALRTVSRTVTLTANAARSRAESNVFVNEPTSGSLARAKGSLYIVTETEGDTAVERGFCRLVADCIRSEYYRDPAQGLAEALSRGVERGNFKMLKDERLPPPEQRPAMAVTCLAIRDGELAIVQTLPVQAYIGNHDGVALVPDPPVWETDGAELTRAFYMGYASQVRYHLYSHKLGNGDLVAVCSSSLAQSLGMERLERWLTGGQLPALAQGIRANYLRAEQEPAYALLIQTRPDVRETAAPSTGEGQGRVRPGSAATTSGPVTGWIARLTGRTEQAAETGRGRPETATRPDGRTDAGTPPRTGPRAGTAAQRVGLRSRQQRLMLAALMAVIVIIILVLLAVKGVQRFQGGREHSAYLQTSAQVDNLLASAAQQSDPTAAAATLSQAKNVLSASSARLDSADRLALSGRIQQREDQLVKASRLTQVKLLVNLSGDRQAQLSQIALEGDNLYMLDTGGHRVLKATTGGGRLVAAISASSVVGQDLIQPLVAIAAIPGGVLAVDSRNTVWSFNAGTNQVRRVSVPGSDTWGEVRAITTYNNELYVLDSRLGHVWRYSPQGDGYSTPVDYFPAAPAAGAARPTPLPTVRPGTPTPAPTATPAPPPDLAHSVGIVVDGSLYMLQSSGDVLKYTNGLPQAFPETGLVGSLTSPSEVTTSPQDSSLYVVDPAGKRIVRFTKDGVFQRQYLLPTDAPAALTGIQGAAVDIGRHQVYLLSDKAVAMATLPNQ